MILGTILQDQEDATNNKTKALGRGWGLVSKSKAKPELAQHLVGDPLPSRKAKVTQVSHGEMS